ncbi:hypothetical protein Mgra_00005780 [Meloidogyne graminicola]|uniref:Uncharacterized protein n=1 Tax=Meloidogyne graminicola TaxID=189291 RepID=A0A8S9ZP17_9BILA|nr:hypothetical protein Mgra_00005780 [Meloidogyne graminicola]
MKLDKNIIQTNSVDKTFIEEINNSPFCPLLDDYSGLIALKYDMMLGKLEKNYMPSVNRTVILVNVIDKEQIEEITTKATTPQIKEIVTKSTTTSIVTTEEPKCILKNHPVLYNGYGCLCCQEHDKCKEFSKNKCPSSMTSFDIFSVSIYSANYNWKCEEEGKTIKCIDTINNKCQKMLCKCDKTLIDCLTSNPRPKQIQPCWSNINETIKEATREPIRAVENVKIDIINANKTLTSILEGAKEGKGIDKKKACDATNAAEKAADDFGKVADKIFEENEKKRQKAKAKTDAAMEKARKTKSLDDLKALDKAMVEEGIILMEIETVGRKIDEVIKVGLENALNTHNIEIRMGNYKCED